MELLGTVATVRRRLQPADGGLRPQPVPAAAGRGGARRSPAAALASNGWSAPSDRSWERLAGTAGRRASPSGCRPWPARSTRASSCAPGSTLRSCRPPRCTPPSWWRRWRCWPSGVALTPLFGGALLLAWSGLRRLRLPDRVPRLARAPPQGAAAARAARLPGRAAPAGRAQAASSLSRFGETSPRAGRSRGRAQPAGPPGAPRGRRLRHRHRACSTALRDVASSQRPRGARRAGDRRWAGRGTSARGVPQALEAAERGLREDERNRLLGAASTVQPKLAAILAGIYLPEFLLLIAGAHVHLHPRPTVRRSDSCGDEA